MKTDLTWRCEAHDLTTTGDCPRCDDELIALTEEAAQKPHCRQCGRALLDGENAWADDWTVIRPEGVRSEIRYTCDDCTAWTARQQAAIEQNRSRPIRERMREARWGGGEKGAGK